MINRFYSAEYLNRYSNNDWILNLYIFKYDFKETVDSTIIDKIVNKALSEVNKYHFSEEFNYYKIGYCLLHFGRRGVDLSIWHLGDWEDTKEYFCCSWYCYNREYESMELLDTKEPIFSMYESSKVCEIISEISEICLNKNYKESIISKFIDRYQCYI